MKAFRFLGMVIMTILLCSTIVSCDDDNLEGGGSSSGSSKSFNGTWALTGSKWYGPYESYINDVTDYMEIKDGYVYYYESEVGCKYSDGVLYGKGLFELDETYTFSVKNGIMYLGGWGFGKIEIKNGKIYEYGEEEESIYYDVWSRVTSIKFPR